MRPACLRLLALHAHRCRLRPALVSHAVDQGLTLIDTADIRARHGRSWVRHGRGAARSDPRVDTRSARAVRPRDERRHPARCPVRLERTGAPGSVRGIAEAPQGGPDRSLPGPPPDFFVHPEELAKTLLRLRSDGKIREIGVSNCTGPQLDALTYYLGPRALATSQPEFSAAHTDPIRDGTLDRCLRDGVTPLTWSPLAGGRLVTGEGIRQELLEVLDDLASREQASRAAVALGVRPRPSPRPVAIVGTQRADRIDEALTSLSVKLDRVDCYRIIEASEGTELP